MAISEDIPRRWSQFGSFAVVLLAAGLISVGAQDCSSDTFNFTLTTITIENISAKQFNQPIADHIVEHVSKVTVSEFTGYGLYIKAELTTTDPKKLIISTNEAFKDFLKNETIPLLQCQLEFTCTSGTRSIRLRVTIKEENLYTPTFSRAIYQVALPLPLPKNFDLTQYVDEGKGIVAYDEDLIGNEVSFSLDENPYFLVEQVPGPSKKEFIARVRTKMTLTRLEEDISLNITGTDAGVPPLFGSAILRISGDPLIPYIAPPQFEKPLYRITYNRRESFASIEVNLEAGTYDESSKFVLSGENSDMFQKTDKGDHSGVVVELKSDVSIPETVHILSVVVTGSRDGSEMNGRTVIVVDVEQEIKHLPAFEQSIFTGTINQSLGLVIQPAVKLIPATILEGVDVSLEGDDARFFLVTENGGIISIAVSSNLTVEVLQEKFFFHFTVKATKPDVGSAVSFVVLEVQREDVISPKFEQLVYEGSITEEGIADLPEVRITDATYTNDLNFSLSGDIQLFSSNIQGNKFVLIPKDISEEKLNGKIYLLIRIRALRDLEVVAETIVIVTIVRKTIIIPKFESSFVQGQLHEENLQFEPLTIVISPSTWTTETELFLKDPSNVFNLNQTNIPNEFSLTLRSDAEVPNKSHLSVIIEAQNPKSSIASCFVVIDVVPAVSPEFEQIMYEGAVDGSGNLQELKLRLRPGTYDSSIVFSVVDQDSDLFTWSKIETNEVQIAFKPSTTSDDYANRNSLRFSVKAVKSETLQAVVPVVVFIERAKVQAPRFKKPLYRSSISPDLALAPFESIELVEETTAPGLQLEVLQNNTDLFIVALMEGQRIVVSLSKELTSADLEGFDRFEFVIEVINPDVGSGYATIVVEVVREEIVVPEFTKPFYTGTLQEGLSDMIFSEKITLKAEAITTYSNYQVNGEDASFVNFEINSDGSLKFSLKNEATSEQLKGKNQINFIVLAWNPGSTTTSASILAKIVRPVQIAFKKTSFNGVLTEGQPMVDFSSDQIEFEDDTLLEGASFELTDGKSDLFLVSKSAETSVQLVLNSSVSWNQIRFNSYLSFQMLAQNPGSNPAATTIIVNIINQPVITPVFTKTVYRGSLQKNSREVIFSAPEVITLQEDTITSTLKYRVTEIDGALFDVLRDENKFKVSLKEGLDEDSIEGRDLLTFGIEANNEFGETDSTTVIVSIPLEEILTPMFSETVYHGSIQENSMDLSFPTEISFQSGTTNTNTEIGLKDGDANWFVATYNNSKVTIAVKDSNAIKWDEITDRSFLSFAMQAVNPGSSPATAFVDLDIERIAVIVPKFKSTSFQGFLRQGSRDVEFEPGTAIELEQGSLIPSHQLLLVDGDFELFDHVLVGLQVKITLKNSVSENAFENRTYLRFNVAATNPGSPTTMGNVLVDLLRNVVPSKVPIFEKFSYKGSIGQDLVLRLEEPIALKEETYSDDVRYEIVETNSDLLELVKQDRRVDVQLTKAITIEEIRDLNSLHITIKATNALGAESVCFLAITLPGESAEPCTSPEPPSVDCTDCYDCASQGPLDDVPIFAYGNYRFNLKSDNTGVIGTVRATVKDNSVTLEHRANFADAYLRSKVSISLEGILRVEHMLLPGQYSFTVTAHSLQSRKYSSVNVLLDVSQDQECPSEPGAPKITTVEKLLLVVSLQEELSHLNIFPSQLGVCEYELVDEKPYYDINYFSIDPETHWLTSRSFDRENKTLFAGMMVPQFQLRLHLVCPIEEVGSRLSKRSLVETGDLNYARDVTVISVIVVDVNDHDPKFIIPLVFNDVYHLGFPSASIAAGLMIPTLITVLAVDADEGFNAEVRFSLGSNSDFGIDPETGAIYPLKGAMKTESVTTITVTATDRAGASDGRSSTVQLSVHRLEKDNLAMVTVPGHVNPDELLQRINTNTKGIEIIILTQARVPEFTSRDRSLKQTSSEDSLLRMIVYGFSNQNEVQSSDTITSIITSSSLSESVTVESYDNVACSNNPDCSGYQSSEEADIGLIVATSILGVLFLISGAIAIFLYLRFVRPLHPETTKPSDVVQLENDFEISPPPSPPMLAGTKQTAVDNPDQGGRKISIQIQGITSQESEDSSIPTARLARSLNDKLERVDEHGTISSRETIEDSSSLPTNEPKNVKFNEMVERIEVVEHHLEDGHQTKRDLEDDDSIYSERL